LETLPPPPPQAANSMTVEMAIIALHFMPRPPEV
jgi:hypothetical protein